MKVIPSEELQKKLKISRGSVQYTLQLMGNCPFHLHYRPMVLGYLCF
uniref:Uncharacterized protein n=1 Tax=Anguilla anguilla TaxID=7936 RepID=A0A0E9XHS5_ANGAN